MRITYRTLENLIARMNDDQKDSDVTAEIFDGENTECFAAELRICDEDHDSLDEGHPVLWVNQVDELENRSDDIDEIAEQIGL
jgi:hypothetical protein